jgi:two-component system, cell cycle sensor histidine kinase and response regulator CckA
MTLLKHIESLSVLGEAFGLPLICFDAAGRTAFATSALRAEIGASPDGLLDFLSAIAPGVDANDIVSRFESLTAQGAQSSVKLSVGGNATPARALVLHAVAIGREDALFTVVVIHELTDDAAVIERVEALERQAQVGFVAAGAAHEFNNLLTAMLGWAQIALRSVDTGSPASAAIQTIENNTRRAKQIATELLDAARPSSSKPKPERLAHLAEEALRLLSWELTAAHIEVTTELGDAGAILGDPTRLLQVLVNVIRNAIEAAPARGALRIRTRRDDDRSIIEISDNGHGIAQEHLDRIFEPFFTTKTRRPDSTGGTGLGLAISKRIVEDHRGTISVQSRRPGGTSVTISIPCCAEGADDAAKEERRSSIPPGIRVLVVDDEPDICEMIRTALTLGGAEVVSALAGAEAVALCQGGRFDAAFVDFSMSGLSGFALGRAIADAQPDLPLVFMSGIEIPRDQDPRFHTFLKKPFDLRDIQCMLHDVLRGR